MKPFLLSSIILVLSTVLCFSQITIDYKVIKQGHVEINDKSATIVKKLDDTRPYQLSVDLTSGDPIGHISSQYGDLILVNDPFTKVEYWVEESCLLPVDSDPIPKAFFYDPDKDGKAYYSAHFFEALALKKPTLVRGKVAPRFWQSEEDERPTPDGRPEYKDHRGFSYFTFPLVDYVSESANPTAQFYFKTIKKISDSSIQFDGYAMYNTIRNDEPIRRYKTSIYDVPEFHRGDLAEFQVTLDGDFVDVYQVIDNVPKHIYTYVLAKQELMEKALDAFVRDQVNDDEYDQTILPYLKTLHRTSQPHASLAQLISLDPIPTDELYCVLSQDLGQMIYSEPNTNSPSVREMSMDDNYVVTQFGDHATIEGNDGYWVKVVVIDTDPDYGNDNKEPQTTGWVFGGYLDPAPQPMSVLRKTTDQVAVSYKTASKLRLRSQPNTLGKILVTLDADTDVEVLQTGEVATIDGITSHWVQIKTPDGQTGWCFGGYLDPQP